MDERGPAATTRRRLLAGLPVLATGALSGCPLRGFSDPTPTPEIPTQRSLATGFDDGTMGPLEPRSEVGETPQVVEALDGAGAVLELATVEGRTCSVRSSPAVKGELTASVQVRRQRGAPDETTIALRLVDRRSGETVGAVVEGGTQNLVRTWPDSGRTVATGSQVTLDTWTELSVTVRSDEVAINGDAIRLTSVDGYDERPLAVELAVSAAASAESVPIVWFDDVDVSAA